MENRQLRALFDRLNELEKSFHENPANDFASYRERVGQCNGLKEATQLLLELESDQDE